MCTFKIKKSKILKFQTSWVSFLGFSVRKRLEKMAKELFIMTNVNCLCLLQVTLTDFDVEKNERCRHAILSLFSSLSMFRTPISQTPYSLYCKSQLMTTLRGTAYE